MVAEITIAETEHQTMQDDVHDVSWLEAFADDGDDDAAERLAAWRRDDWTLEVHEVAIYVDWFGSADDTLPASLPWQQIDQMSDGRYWFRARFWDTLGGVESDAPADYVQEIVDDMMSTILDDIESRDIDSATLREDIAWYRNDIARNRQHRAAVIDALPQPAAPLAHAAD